jgi:transmembrane protein 18
MQNLKFAKPEGILENLEAFFTAVNIKETFNTSLVIFHILTFVLILATKNYHKVQLGIFIFLLLLCYFLETINTYLGKHWRDFTSQNYFDKSGFFICVMVGFPALCNCVLVMVNSFRNTFSMLVLVIKKKSKEKKN